MKTGIELIAEERKRQVEVEGWTNLHDDDYDAMQLSGAEMMRLAWTLRSRHGPSEELDARMLEAVLCK